MRSMRERRDKMNSKRYFDTVASHWDAMREGFFSKNVREKAFDIAHLEKGKLAADIGAGTGYITEGLIESGLRVIAIDQSEAMLDVLKTKLPFPHRIDCRVGEADNLPVEDNLVDFVFANMYLHHVEDPFMAIKEMVRILKPGGSLIITDMDEHDFSFLMIEHRDRWMGFKREDIERWLKEAGLKEVKLVCVGENCCAKSDDGSLSASVSVFVAFGKK